jgi:hypothetical protein
MHILFTGVVEAVESPCPATITYGVDCAGDSGDTQQEVDETEITVPHGLM